MHGRSKQDSPLGKELSFIYNTAQMSNIVGGCPATPPMTNKQETTPEVKTDAKPSPSSQLVDFLREHGWELRTNSTVFVADQFRDVIHPSIAKAVDLNMLQVSVQISVHEIGKPMVSADVAPVSEESSPK